MATRTHWSVSIPLGLNTETSSMPQPSAVPVPLWFDQSANHGRFVSEQEIPCTDWSQSKVGLDIGHWPTLLAVPAWIIVSNSRGIGAARRWIKQEFENISSSCSNCLEVFYQKDLIKKGTNQRIVNDVWVVNVVAIQRGTKHPNRFIIMSGDIDSRVTDPTDFTSDSPGANDNASGMAGTIEAASLEEFTKILLK